MSIFQNFKIFNRVFPKIVEKSNFRRKTIYCLFKNKLLVLKTFLNIALGKNLTGYLQTVLRLTVI